MRSRLALTVCLVALLVAFAFILPASRHFIIGTLRGEPFADGRPLSYWVEELKSRNTDERGRAADALGKMGALAKPAVPALIEALNDTTIEKELTAKSIYSPVYERVAQALGKIGPDAVAAAPALLEYAARPWNAHSFESARALVAIGPDSLPEVIKALDHPHAHVRFDAVLVVKEFGPKAKDAIPGLIRIIGDPSCRPGESGPAKARNLFYLAAMTLADLGPPTQDVVPVLLQAVQEGVAILDSAGEFNCFREPLTSILKLRPDIHLLLQTVHDREEATRKLGDAKGFFVFLARALQAKEMWMREYAAFSLSQGWLNTSGTKLDPVILAELNENLRRALKSERPLLRLNAACALAYNPNWEDVVPAVLPLCEALKAAPVRSRLRALTALEVIARRGSSKLEIGPEIREALPTLLAVWQDDTGDLRFGAGTILKLIDPEAAAKAGVK